MRILVRILAVMIGVAGVLTLAIGVTGMVVVGRDDTVTVAELNPDIPGVALVTAPGFVNVYGPTLTLTARSTTPGPTQPLFLGVCPEGEVANYLQEYRRTIITGYQWPNAVSLSQDGTRSSVTQPGRLDLWTVKAKPGSATTLRYPMTNGKYAFVLMRVDGSALNQVDVRVDITIAGMFKTALAIAAGGLGAIVVCLFVFWVTRLRRSPSTSPAPEPTPTPDEPPREYSPVETGTSRLVSGTPNGSNS